MPGRAGIKQQLQGQDEACVARLNGTNRSQRATGAVAAHRDAAWVQPEPRTLACHPLHDVPGIVLCHRKLVFRCQTVVHRQHGAARQMRQPAAQRVMRGNAADGETATMEVHQHRQLNAGRCVQAHRNVKAVAGLDRKAFHTVHGLRRDVQHVGSAGIGGARLLGSHGVHGDFLRAVHALQYLVHGGRQQGQRIAVVVIHIQVCAAQSKGSCCNTMSISRPNATPTVPGKLTASPRSFIFACLQRARQDAKWITPAMGS